jgi:hypothetical protein
MISCEVYVTKRIEEIATVMASGAQWVLVLHQGGWPRPFIRKISELNEVGPPAGLGHPAVHAWQLTPQLAEGQTVSSVPCEDILRSLLLRLEQADRSGTKDYINRRS